MTNIVAENRQARRRFAIEQTLEVGMHLRGSEVKSLRKGQGNISDAHAFIRGEELFLANMYIAPHQETPDAFQHIAKRERKLLAHHQEIRKWYTKTSIRGYAIVPLQIYMNERGRMKCLLGLGKGKTHQDQRDTIKERHWKRDQSRILRERNR